MLLRIWCVVDHWGTGLLFAHALRVWSIVWWAWGWLLWIHHRIHVVIRIIFHLKWRKKWIKKRGNVRNKNQYHDDMLCCQSNDVTSHSHTCFDCNDSCYCCTCNHDNRSWQTSPVALASNPNRAVFPIEFSRCASCNSRLCLPNSWTRTNRRTFSMEL